MTKIQKSAEQAKSDQLDKMDEAVTNHGALSLQAYWAGSVSASVAHHVRRKAVRVIKAGV